LPYCLEKFYFYTCEETAGIGQAGHDKGVMPRGTGRETPGV
jgi:hypothetical protein